MKKTALVTGASRGIGFSIAKSLETEFETLILIAKHKETLDKAVSKITKTKVIPIVADLTNQSEILSVTKKVLKNFSSLDLLVNNAGIYIGKDFEKMSIEEINQMINLNFTAYYLLTQKLLPLLKKGDNPQIINISSCAAHATLFGESLYSATKSAVTTFSNIIRQELNPEGIRVTAIQPWAVDTYETPAPDVMLNPDEVGKVVKFIVNTTPVTQIDIIELSHIKQWRGEKPSWIE